ncbi:ribosomal protein S2, flavodoxin-like domain-containing protein [Mycena alexandri]|uniref:Ribosomal protein S2, flavodoxin-like domain-containing protein n=1 Tax=Mycena alexandri TaxID=1745969 RepID=A0AAD6THB8_9AGAR|nr:ribosomal protein S2, flavodoxin-like domain-containing protein [Mycena alexandri]
MSACRGLARAARRRVPRLTRAYSDQPELGDRPLRTFEDWTQLQLKRAEVGTLIDIFSDYGSNRKQRNTFKLRDGVRRPVPNATVSSLLAAGAHFGHSSTRMNPNFIPYAYGVRAQSTIIDLDHTVPLLRRAANLVRAVAFAGGQILFIGTRPDLRQIVKSAAGRIGKQGYYISDRWIPGTLTNTAELFTPQVAAETLSTPDLVILLNPLTNLTCIRECALAHVPTIGIIDSDADPRIVMYPIPANDESPQTAEIVAGILSIAGREGLALRMEEEVMEEESEQNDADDEFWDQVEVERAAEAAEDLNKEQWIDAEPDPEQSEEKPFELEQFEDEEQPSGQRFDY